MLTFNWAKNNPNPISAVKTLHSCQNMDLLNEWRAANDVKGRIKFLERPTWVLNPDIKKPGKLGPAESTIREPKEEEGHHSHDKRNPHLESLFPEIKDAEMSS
jgi:hypothetical protein